MNEDRSWGHRLSIGMVATLLTVGASSCQNGSPPPYSDNRNVVVNATSPENGSNTNIVIKESEIELERFRNLWATKNISDYEIETSLFAGGTRYIAEPVRIHVRNGIAVSVEPLSKENKGSVDGYAEFQTVERAFDVIEDAIHRGLEFEVTYNKDFGYPESLLVYESSRASDAYTSLRIHRLRMLAE